ncbi:MAG: hypothetical protein WC208_13350 [Gallionella sp.]
MNTPHAASAEWLSECDVLEIGGGSAGSAAAALLADSTLVS